MRIEEIKTRVFLIADCPRPVSNEQVCAELAAEGIDSILVVDDDTTPWPSGQGSLWCYVRPFADAAHPIPAELQRVTDFVHYETSNNRSMGMWIGYSELEELVVQTALAKPPEPRRRAASDDPCCCRPYHSGCLGELVCHATAVELAEKAFESGHLLSRPVATGKSLDRVTQEMREWGQADPPDYFDFICFANGNCVAPDKVAMERHAGRWLDAKQCDEDFYPGVRFFFNPAMLADHPKVAWDGIQAVKIRDRLDLLEYLVVAVAPEVDRSGEPLSLNIPPNLRERVIRLDHQKNYGLSAWSDAAFGVAKERMSNNCVERTR
ncbi:MAG: hypothetical protein KAW89_00590 [Armatimonadetes bacterium]|nr:hypothetical protein [Armatimonadota bacterium]